VANEAASQGLKLTDKQTVALNISSVVASGDLQTDNCVSPLAAQSSCTINVAFKPMAIGPDRQHYGQGQRHFITCGAGLFHGGQLR
jgi:hypothetical protein